MRSLEWNQIDLGRVVFAGLVSGYVMAIVGLWSGRIAGLISVDIADMGRRYIVSDRSSAWFFCLASHLVNSVLLVFVWAKVIAPNLPVSFYGSAVIWGLALCLVLANGLVAPMSGMGIMGHKTGDHRFALTNIILHIVWGATIGFLYTPL